MFERRNCCTEKSCAEFLSNLRDSLFVIPRQHLRSAIFSSKIFFCARILEREIVTTSKKFEINVQAKMKRVTKEKASAEVKP